MNELMNLKVYITEQIKSSGAKAKDKETTLKDMLPLLIDNDFWGLAIELAEDNGNPVLMICKDEVSKLEANISFFLSHYDKPVNGKAQILMQHLENRYTLTTPELWTFYEEHEIEESEQYLLNDFLLYRLEKDVHLYNNQEIKSLIQHACEDLSLRVSQTLIYFLSWLRKKTKTNYIIDFTLEKRRLYGNRSPSYDGDTMLQMIYYLFNDDYIQKERLFLRAASNPGVANCWIYLALHCISALRDTDIVRIPHPRLHRPPEDILQSVKETGIEEEIAFSITNSILWQLKNRPLTPSKTASYSNVSDIKLFFPESSITLFGSMFAILEAHHQLNQKDGPFIVPAKEYDKISSYLGDDIGELFLENDFRARSANKAYMQAIGLLSDTILDNAPMIETKGYMLAALARSHKGSYGEFASTTKEYLEDAAFSGYTEEYVAKELFERGVCSFVVNMLLNIVTENKFSKLSISKQTTLIKETSMSAWEIDTIVGAVDASIETAKRTVSKLFLSEGEGNTEEIIKVLHNIGSGNAASKSDDFLCLMTAMGKMCPYRDSAQCIGCEYEITTKASVFLLVHEFKRLLYLREATEEEHLKQKYTLLLKETVAPTLNEMFTVITSSVGEEAAEEYAQIIKEIMHE